MTRVVEPPTVSRRERAWLLTLLTLSSSSSSVSLVLRSVTAVIKKQPFRKCVLLTIGLTNSFKFKLRHSRSIVNKRLHFKIILGLGKVNLNVP